MMADAHARMTGRPGVAFVTRGPGATNGSIGIHIAQQDSVPLVLFVGLPGSDVTDREAFQEFDLNAVFRSLGKWSEIIPSTDRIPEFVSRAFHRAMSGRPGPVVLGLPEDVLVGPLRRWRPAAVQWSSNRHRGRATWHSSPTCSTPPSVRSSSLAARVGRPTARRDCSARHGGSTCR